MGTPSVHPMGTIIYKPEKCYNGYTLFQANEHGATLIDMNGGVVNHWHNLEGFPNKLLSNGDVFGCRGPAQQHLRLAGLQGPGAGGLERSRALGI